MRRAHDFVYPSRTSSRPERESVREGSKLSNVSSGSPLAPTEQKKLGAFYTPRNMADKLVTWAVREPDDVVLDPRAANLEVDFELGEEERRRIDSAARQRERLFNPEWAPDWEE